MYHYDDTPNQICNQLVSCAECRDNACAFNVDQLGSQNGLCADSCSSLYCNQVLMHIHE